MAVATAERRVLELTVPIQSLTGVQTQRITTLDCLNADFVREQMSPNQLALLEINGQEWGAIVPHGAYSPREHIMLMPWGKRSVVGPERLDPIEGEKLFFAAGKIAARMAADPTISSVVFGWNWSTRSYGQKGYQSVPTKFHASVFGLPFIDEEDSNIRFVDAMHLKPEEVRSLKGGRHNLQIGKLLTQSVLNGNFTGDRDLRDRLLDKNQASLDSRGLRVPFNGTIDQFLMTASVFGNFFLPIAKIIDEASIHFSQALTDFDSQLVDEMVTDGLNNASRRAKILDYLVRVPNLRPRFQRRARLKELEDVGYDSEIVDGFIKMSDRLSEEGGPWPQWKRGFGYALSLVYNPGLGRGTMSIFSEAFDGPGGIVESGIGAILRRPQQPFSQEEMDRKKKKYYSLVDGLVT